MDLSPLYIDLLNEQDPYLQKIALTGMKGRTEPEVLDRLIRLSDSEDKDLRLKAVQACIRQDSSAAVPHIPIWLRHEDWEIRAEAVEAAGASGNPFFYRASEVVFGGLTGSFALMRPKVCCSWRKRALRHCAKWLPRRILCRHRIWRLK